MHDYNKREFLFFQQQYLNIIKESNESKLQSAVIKNHGNNQNLSTNQLRKSKLREYNEYLKNNHFITYVLRITSY